MFRRERPQTNTQTAKQPTQTPTHQPQPTLSRASKHLAVLQALADNLTMEQRMLKEKAEAHAAQHIKDIERMKALREAEEFQAKVDAEAKAIGSHKYRLPEPSTLPDAMPKGAVEQQTHGYISKQVKVTDIQVEFEKQIRKELVTALHERLSAIGMSPKSSLYSIASAIGLQYQTLLMLVKDSGSMGLKRIAEVCAALDYIPQFSLMDSRKDQ